MATYKTISVSEETFRDFERMADSYGLTNKGLVEAMLTYFKVTKADPRSPQADNPTDAIKALDKRLISFIKEQEKKILIPIKEAVFDMASSEGVPRRSDLRIVNTNVKRIITGLKLDE
ncbi:BfmA/BtgA family mobilization protein [Spirosoma aerophilum]